MSWKSLHTIRRHHLDIEVNGNESDGLLLQRNLPTLLTQGLLPAIERALDHCAPEQGFLYIERLDIDVGTMALDRLEHDLPKAVTLALEKEITNQMVLRNGPGVIKGRNATGHAHRRTTTQETFDEALAYFLKTGSLPSSWYLSQGETFEEVLLAAWQEVAECGMVLSGAGEALMDALNSEVCRDRLTLQFSTGFLLALLSRLSPKGEKTVKEVLSVIRSTNLSLSDTKALERALWKVLFTHVAAGQDIEPRMLVGKTIHFLSANTACATMLANLLERYWRDPIRAVVRNGGLTGLTGGKPIGTARADKVDLGSTEHPEAAEGVFIDNAGLVLLHPFLTRFFEGLGVAADRDLLQPTRALHLLHYLSSGLASALEYELVLPKILCNLPLTKPVEADLELSTPEKDEAVALLEAVIGHWTALRNTSPDGLRGAFLLRPGKLSLHDGDWLLQVESRTVDILFNQLPWGISMIKLPWMDQILTVEWG